MNPNHYKKTPQLRRSPHQNGFTLVELLTVVAIMVILLSMVGPAFNHVERYRVKSEAQKFASALRSARQYSLENSTHTRVVFSDKELEEFTEGGLPANKAYGSYAFYKPVLPSGGSDYKPFITEEGLTQEFASMPFTSIPSGFVGQFIPLPNVKAWRLFDKRVEVDVFVPDNVSVRAGFEREFFSESNVIAELDNERPGTQKPYTSNWYYNPEKFWDFEGVSFYHTNVPNAQYPRNYFQTPYPVAYPLVASTQMPGEPSNFEAGGRQFPYNELWSERVNLLYFQEIEDYVSFKELGQPEPDGKENRRFFNLKGIEFSPKGLPTQTWAEEIVFQFRPKGGAAYPAYEVTIDRITGLANVRKAQIKRE